MNTRQLMEHFNFDESDLQANRGGYLSSKQIARLMQNDKPARRVFLIIGLVFATLTVLPSLILWLMGRLNSAGWYSLLWMIPCGALGFFFIRAGLKSIAYTLRSVEGEIEITKGGSYHDPAGVYYELHIGGRQFGIGERLASHLKKESGNIYSVYFYWGSDTVETDLMDAHIMSLEKTW